VFNSVDGVGPVDVADPFRAGNTNDEVSSFDGVSPFGMIRVFLFPLGLGPHTCVWAATFANLAKRRKPTV